MPTHKIYLDAKGWEEVSAVLNNPPKPNAALRKLAKAYRQAVRNETLFTETVTITLKEYDELREAAARWYLQEEHNTGKLP